MDIDNKQLLIFTVDAGLRFSLTNNPFNRKKYIDNYTAKMKVLFGFSSPINNKLYTIKIEFTKGFGESWKNFYWHHSQRWEEMLNGNYMLYLHCSIGRELIGFIAFGLDKMKVHQPKILKELIIKKLRQTLGVYENDWPIDEEEANRDY